MEKETTSSNSKLHSTYIAIIVILFIVIGGCLYVLHQKSERLEFSGTTERGVLSQKQKGPGRKGMGGMMMAAVTPPALSDQQNQQITVGSSAATVQKTFNITGGNFYFVPNRITVNKGDQVTFVMTNAGGIHDLVIDELSVKTPVIHTGEAATVSFTANKTGSFVYYCDVPSHKEKGMLGTLIVQ